MRQLSKRDKVTPELTIKKNFNRSRYADGTDVCKFRN